MKKNLLIFISLLFAAPAFGISLTDYKVPVSTTENMEVELSYNYHGSGDTTRTNLGSGNLDYERYYESPSFGYHLEMLSTGNYDGKASKNLNHFSGSVNVSGGLKKYVMTNRLFVFGGTNIKYKREQTQIDSLKTYKRPSISLEAGVGYGKYINATPLAKALRVESELKKLDVLTGQLPDETRLDMAKLLSDEKKREYEDRYESGIWERYYFEDLEEILLSSGMVKGNFLEAIAIIQIQQVIHEEHFNDRFYGWEVRFGVSHQVLTRKKEIDPQSSAKISMGYAVPITRRSQFQINAESKSEVTAFFDAYEASIRPGFTHEIGSKIDFSTYYRLNFVKEKGETVKKSHEMRATFEYYLEGKMTLVQRLTFKKDFSEKNWDRIFMLTLRYNIL